MALLYNLAAMTVASTGTGTITLGSAATINGVLFLSFAAAGVSNGEVVAYSINDVGGSEVGTGTYTSSGTTLSRTPVTSTNSNNAINMTAAAIVRISPAKEDIANLRQANTFTSTTGQTINGPIDISGASAGQIVFPATQNPSAGANTLDDYEEGTWTPTILFGGASTGITYTTQSGTYTKIGNRVCFECLIIMTSKGSATGTATYGGLPFSVTNTAPVAFTYNNMAAGATTWLLGNAGAAVATQGALQRYAAGTLTNLADTDFTATSVLRIGGTYSV